MNFVDDLFSGKTNKHANQAEPTSSKLPKSAEWASDLDDALPEEVIEVEAAKEEKKEEPKAETVKDDYERLVEGLSDYNLAEKLAEFALKDKALLENFPTERDKQLEYVQKNRKSAETKLLKFVGDHTLEDWDKALKKFEKEVPEQPSEKDLHSETKVKKVDWKKPKELDMPSDKERIKEGPGVEQKEKKSDFDKKKKEASKKTASASFEVDATITVEASDKNHAQSIAEHAINAQEPGVLDVEIRDIRNEHGVSASLRKKAKTPFHSSVEEYLAYLEEDIIPDSKSSGKLETAKDLETVATLLRNGQSDPAFVEYLQNTLIPDLEESGSTGYVTDFVDGIYWLQRIGKKAAADLYLCTVVTGVNAGSPKDARTRIETLCKLLPNAEITSIMDPQGNEVLQSSYDPGELEASKTASADQHPPFGSWEDVAHYLIDELEDPEAKLDLSPQDLKASINEILNMSPEELASSFKKMFDEDPVVNETDDIKPVASKTETIKKVAEVNSIWKVVKDDTGNDVIARTEPETIGKQSEEDERGVHAQASKKTAKETYDAVWEKFKAAKSCGECNKRDNNEPGKVLGKWCACPFGQASKHLDKLNRDYDYKQFGPKS